MTAVGALLTMAALAWMVSAALIGAWRLTHRGESEPGTLVIRLEDERHD